jgi:hypothetical protein
MHSHQQHSEHPSLEFYLAMNNMILAIRQSRCHALDPSFDSYSALSRAIEDLTCALEV